MRWGWHAVAGEEWQEEGSREGSIGARTAARLARRQAGHAVQEKRCPHPRLTWAQTKLFRFRACSKAFRIPRQCSSCSDQSVTRAPIGGDSAVSLPGDCVGKWSSGFPDNRWFLRAVSRIANAENPSVTFLRSGPPSLRNVWDDCERGSLSRFPPTSCSGWKCSQKGVRKPAGSTLALPSQNMSWWFRISPHGQVCSGAASKVNKAKIHLTWQQIHHH